LHKLLFVGSLILVLTEPVMLALICMDKSDMVVTKIIGEGN
jgi:hypothetical protein